MNIKTISIQFIIFLTLIRPALAICSDEYALLVFDSNSQILEQERADEMKYPASLVKMMTLYLTFEAIEQNKINFNTVLKPSERAINQWKFNADLQENDTLTTKEAVLGIIVKSFNDFAVVLAEAVGKNEWNFVKMMNKKAKELGLEKTYFRNSAGFTDEQQLTTTYDMAKLVQAIKKDFPQYYPLFSTKKFRFKGKTYKSHNHVLTDYKWARGMKTGFTNASGYNLATTANKDGNDLTAVVISCSTIEDRDDFMISILDKHFEKLSQTGNPTLQLSSKNEHKIIKAN